MSFTLFGGAIIFALLDWFSVYRVNKKIERFAKPLTMAFLIAWVVTSAVVGGYLSGSTITWFLVGMTLCLIGDIFLFLPPERWFLIGLVSFLLGHVGYIVSFGAFKFDHEQIIPAVILGIVVVVIGILIDRRLVSSLIKKNQSQMVIPIIIYSVVISFMLYSAGFKFIERAWALPESLLLAAGALLFYISDILNAWERFVSKFKNDRLIIMMTYHLGQFGLAAGMVLHLSQKIMK